MYLSSGNRFQDSPVAVVVRLYLSSSLMETSHPIARLLMKRLGIFRRT